MDGKDAFLRAMAAVRNIQSDLDQHAGARSTPSTPNDHPVEHTKHSVPVVPTPLRNPDLTTTPDKDDKPIKVLVSWAHTDKGWSKDETDAWEAEVMKFTLGLIDSGIDADLDLFHAHDNLADWTRFGQKAVEESDYVLVAMSKPWAERWSGNNKPTVGAGVAVEADTLKGIFSANQDALQNKLKIVVLASKKADDIPHDMNRFQRFGIDAEKRETYTDLLRTITNQPLYVKPKLGKVPVLAPAALGPSVSSSAVGISASKPPVSAPRTDTAALKQEYDFLSAELKLGKSSDKDLKPLLRRMSILRGQLFVAEKLEDN
jgi:hypothetical protein